MQVEGELSSAPDDAATDATTKARPGSTRLEWATLVTVAPFIAAAWRVYVVAGYDDATMKAVIVTLNIPDLLIGTFVTVIVDLALVALVAHAMLRYPEYRKVAGRIPVARLARYAFIFLTLMFLSATDPLSLSIDAITAVLIAGGFLVYEFYLHVKREVSSQAAASRAAKRLTAQLNAGARAFSVAVTLLAGLFVVSTIATSGMWLPAETISVTGKDSPEVGYVLADNNDELVVLMRDGDGVVRIAKRDVRARAICREGPSSAPVFTLIVAPTVKQPRTPRCPTPLSGSSPSR